MARRKLSLSSNIKGQSTISSFFTKKSSSEQTNTVNGQLKASSSCDALKATGVSTNTEHGSNTSAKRPSKDVDEELPLVQSLKKAKVSDSDPDPHPSSPDFIPATPENDSKKSVKSSKSKSKRKISLALSPEVVQNKILRPEQISSSRNSNDLAPKKQLQKSASAPERKTNDSVVSVIQQPIKNCNNPEDYTTSEDPLLAEILEDMVVIDWTLPSSKENADSKSVNTTKTLQQSNGTDTMSCMGKQSEKRVQQELTNYVPESKSCKSTPSTPKKKEGTKNLNKLGHLSVHTKQSVNEQDSNEILRDSTATKSSPNKEQSSVVTNKSCEVKPRNIFLDDPTENSPSRPSFFVKRISHKKKPLNKPDSNYKDLKTPNTKIPSPHKCDLLTDLRTSEVMKNAHVIVESNPTLSALKKKLMGRKPDVNLPSVEDKVSQLDIKMSLSHEKMIVEVPNGENLARNGCEENLYYSHPSNNIPPQNNEANQIGTKSSKSCDTVSVQNVTDRMSLGNLTDSKMLSNTEGKKPEEVSSYSVLNVIEKDLDQNYSELDDDTQKMEIETNEEVPCSSADIISPADAKKIISALNENGVEPSESHIRNDCVTSAIPTRARLLKKSETQCNPGYSFEDFGMECFDDDWTFSQFQTDKTPEAPVSYEETLDLTSPVHCKVLSVEVVKPHRESKMWVECVKTGRTASCTVRGSWLCVNVQNENIVCLEAVSADKTSRTRWLIDDSHGMLVMHPDTLISGTAVVGSLFCVRRSVLAASYKGFDGNNGVMAIGTMIHEILQEVLKKNVRKLEDIKQLAERMLSHRNTVRLCYEADMSFNDVRKEFNLFLPSIESFVSKYVTIDEPRKKGNFLGVPAKVGQPGDKRGDFRKDAQEWSGNIIAIEDIEENIWDPMLGIKGKIDVTVKVKDNSGSVKVLPLELKTGRASHSAEHRGQVMLYSMMMSRLGTPVQSGLLLYLRESSIREVKLSHQEERDLLILRNRLAQNLEVQAKVNVEDIENVPTLPSPINFEKACSKCPYLTLCSVHLKREKEIKLRDDHPMKSLSDESTKHLTAAHTDYFFYWTRLIRLETQEQKSILQKNIWSLAPEKREKLGQALVNLRIDNVIEDAGRFSHNFFRNYDVGLIGSQPLSDDFRKCSLNVGDYVVVSTNTRIAVDTGFVLSVESASICLSLNRDLRKRNPNSIFHLDTYESDYAMAFNLVNLSSLLDDTDATKRVREAVIDRVPPTFSGKIKEDVLKELMPVLAKLNNAQREAAMTVLRSDRYTLIKGLPGTGKTATMVALVCLLVKLGQSVLITGHTHSAVDNLLLRLKHEGVNFLRLGSASRIHPELKNHSEGFVTQNCHTPEELATVLETYQVVGVTCLGMNHPMFFRGRLFDICLVDESTQVLQSTVLRPLLNAKRFVLVGDPDQLPPVVRSPRARELGLEESLFAHLDKDGATKSLNLNYRMNQAITDLANSLTYKGVLKCGNSKVANTVLDLPKLQEVRQGLPPSDWLSPVLLPSLSASVLFLDSGGARLDIPPDWEESVSSEYGSKIDVALINFYEVKVLTSILAALVKAGIDQNEVGIIAPYRAQVTLIRKVLEPSQEYNKIEVNSVDQYQGRDKQVILYSCTRSDSCARLPKDYEILNDHRRLTVAITRAKCKLVLIGDKSTLKSYAPFSKFFSCLSPKQDIKMPPQF